MTKEKFDVYSHVTNQIVAQIGAVCRLACRNGSTASREAHGVRALLSTRKALLKKTMDLANEVRGLLLRHLKRVSE